MTNLRTIQTHTGLVSGVEVEVISSNEPWGTYLLADGTLVRIKLIVTTILKVEGPPTPNSGPPIYVQFQTVVVTDPPQSSQDNHDGK